MAELLLEIGVEEVPALLVRPTLDQLRERAAALFGRARLEVTNLRTFGTPRRLALTVGLPARQQAQAVEVTGPPAAAAYDAAGQPTAAAIGFAKAQGVAVEALRLIETGRGKYLAARREEKALPTGKVLQQLLPELIGQLEFPKAMRWNASGQRFIRPVRWIVALLDRQMVVFSFAGVKSGARSYGHRGLAPKTVTIRRSADYVAQLRRAFVLVDDEARRAEIDQQVKVQESARGVLSYDNESVISQMVYSCEWPIVVVGVFDEDYLNLSRALRLAVLRQQQGYLPLTRPDHGKVPIFFCVLDGVAKQFMPGKQPKDLAAVVHDHERVLRARLEDARFYEERDLAVKLADRVETLKGVTFHEKLGTLHDKTLRVMELARWLAPLCGVDAKEAGRAAELCKADLVTGLVREFPELQGVIGGEYAEKQGETEMVARAIGEHYQPRAAGDALPNSTLGQVLSLADKIDTLVGYFGVGLAPTGSEDPYGLRRQATGVVSIAMLCPMLDLFGLIKQANKSYKEVKDKWRDDTIQSVHAFLTQRLEWQLLSEGYRSDLVAAVLVGPWKYPVKVKRFALALQSVISTPVGDDLLTVYRRVGRIVPAGFNPGDVNKELLTEPELALYSAYLPLERFDVQGAIDQENEHEILKELAQLRPVVDEFFTKVMVMDDDLALQNNRLQLVDKVKKAFGRVADFSKISTVPATQETTRVGGSREA